MNIFVYAICLFLFNIELVIYSLIYTTVLAMAIDRVHFQNINTSYYDIYQEDGHSRAIIEQILGRKVTNWDGKALTTNKTSYICL